MLSGLDFPWNQSVEKVDSHINAIVYHIMPSYRNIPLILNTPIPWSQLWGHFHKKPWCFVERGCFLYERGMGLESFFPWNQSVEKVDSHINAIISIYSRVVHEKPAISWGTPMAMETPIPGTILHTPNDHLEVNPENPGLAKELVPRGVTWWWWRMMVKNGGNGQWSFNDGLMMVNDRLMMV